MTRDYDRVRIHDYRARFWGHDFVIRPDKDPATAAVTGWGYGVREKDMLILPNSDGACFYTIESLDRPRDPMDMWFAKCRFVPASSDVGVRTIASLDDNRVSSPISLTSWWLLREPA